MLFAAVRDDAYNVTLVIHLAAVMVAFAPVILGGFQQAHLEANGGDDAVVKAATSMKIFSSAVSGGALLVVLLTGIGMVVMSDDDIEFSDAWISVAFVLWFVIAGVITGMVGKGERLKSEGDVKGMNLVQWGSTVAVALGVVMLYVMVVKPWL